MTSRGKILGRIREALSVQAPVPGHAHEDNAPVTATDTAALRQWLPPVGGSWEEQRDLFAQNSAALKTEFTVVSDAPRATAELKRIAKSDQWKRLAAHRTPLVEEVLASVGLETLWVDDGVGTAALEGCDGGVTACEALVAQTGSVLVSSRGSGGRALSVLPPHHIVIARRDQMVPDLSAAFEFIQSKYGDDYPSMLSFVTGPSRTGDIERILVLGAHGPKKLTILCF